MCVNCSMSTMVGLRWYRRTWSVFCVNRERKEKGRKESQVYISDWSCCSTSPTFCHHWWEHSHVSFRKITEILALKTMSIPACMDMLGPGSALGPQISSVKSKNEVSASVNFSRLPQVPFSLQQRRAWVPSKGLWEKLKSPIMDLIRENGPCCRTNQHVSREGQLDSWWEAQEVDGNVPGEAVWISPAKGIVQDLFLFSDKTWIQICILTPLKIKWNLQLTFCHSCSLGQ